MNTTIKRKRALIYHDEQGVPFAALIANAGQRPFFVSCHHDAKAKRIRYAYALSEHDAERLGVNGMTYGQESAHAERVWIATLS